MTAVSGSRPDRAADYVIIGAGSAGCLLADRLSAAGAAVLLLEAGGWDRDPLIHIPLGLGRMHEKRSHDWGYDYEPDPGLAGRSIETMRGKVLGGSSAINHMSHVRGNPGDYDRWAAQGLDGWSYAEVLPYFRRYERWHAGADAYRGGEGPLCVTARRGDDPLFQAFAQAAINYGLRYTEDYNGERQDGFGHGQSTIAKGRRQSAATAFLRPALQRPGLRLETKAQATRIIMEGNRAVGVEYRQDGRSKTARADVEVILSGGVYNSPQLLMLSGIGPAQHLREHGIAVRIDHPGVGANLQDHLGVIVAATRPVPGPFHAEMRLDRMTVSMLRAFLFGTGPATSLPAGMHAYIRTEPGLSVPDIQLIFRGVSSKPHLWLPLLSKPYQDRCGIRPVLLHPESRGEVRLRSANPLERVRIHGNFLSREADLRRLREGIAVARRLLADSALDGFRGKEVTPGPAVQSNAELDAWIRRTALTAHHPAGTCAMGSGDAAVLDSQLRLRGATGLRVVDASAMPDMVSGNINACVTMIAEKASDMILDRPAMARPSALPVKEYA